MIDEASGRTPATGPWRADEPAAAPARPRGQWLTAAVVVALLAVALAFNWTGSPWATAHRSADVVALADEATMTATGRDVFYGNDPQLLGATDFPGRCPTHASGCYIPASRSIVVYRPADERLHGWVLTAATHEMLHAAYDSLSPADRREVDALLASTVAALPPDNPTLAQIDASVGGHEQSRSTEQFAYVGTQVPQVDPRLDAVYARFLDDRQAVVAAYTTTTTLLSDMAMQLIVQQQILSSMEAEGSTADITAQRAVVDSLSADVATLQGQLAAAG